MVHLRVRMSRAEDLESVRSESEMLDIRVVSTAEHRAVAAPGSVGPISSFRSLSTRTLVRPQLAAS